MTYQEREILASWFPARVAAGRNITNAERDAACARMREMDGEVTDPTGEVAAIVDDEIARFRRIVARWNRRPRE